ncbi:hypothetical protein NDU88_006397 [Pleurodeles waltl]|uniref:Uncharacterized protein n=1 Tax=Pleurodeles waltl TaxID=8319 RepID=A0AAV7U084_PLEWA|nr:hypothetical protein NDU88_006397 [Pleurodeles waltl]
MLVDWHVLQVYTLVHSVISINNTTSREKGTGTAARGKESAAWNPEMRSCSELLPVRRRAAVPSRISDSKQRRQERVV